MSKTLKEMEAELIEVEELKPLNKYDRFVVCKQTGNVVLADVYTILSAFKVENPALQHLIKKALCTGIRGHKNKEQDLQDIIDSAIRAKELE